MLRGLSQHRPWDLRPIGRSRGFVHELQKTECQAKSLSDSSAHYRLRNGKMATISWELSYNGRVYLFVLIIVPTPPWDCRLPPRYRWYLTRWHVTSILSRACTNRCMYLGKCLPNWIEETQVAKTHHWSNELEYLGTEPGNVQLMSTLAVLIHSKLWEPRFSSSPYIPWEIGALFCQKSS